MIYMDKKILIISGATGDYLELMLKLYKSLRTFHKNVYFEANLIIEKCDKLNELYKKKLNSYKFDSNNKVKDDFLIINVIKKKFINENHKRNFSSNIRYDFLNKNLKNYEMVFWMDADSIIRKPLFSLFKIDNKYKIIIKNHKVDNKLHSYGSKEPIRRQFKSGIMGFRNHESSYFLLNNWYKIMNLFDSEYWCWFEDQLIIGYIMKKVFNKYGSNNFYDLPKEYIDWDLDVNSHIWVGKGFSKEL